MSLKQHTDASLAGFGQPIFPPACEKINGLLSEKGGYSLMNKISIGLVVLCQTTSPKAT